MPINTAKLAKIQQQSEKARLGGKVKHDIIISLSLSSIFIGNPEEKEKGRSQDSN